MFYIHFLGAELRRRAGRTALTALGLAVGVGLVVIIGALSANSGPIITTEEASWLTEPFRRLGTARTGDGVGVGLSIAASVARAHGGRLEVMPLEGGGLRVTAALPAAGDRAKTTPQALLGV